MHRIGAKKPLYLLLPHQRNKPTNRLIRDSGTWRSRCGHYPSLRSVGHYGFPEGESQNLRQVGGICLNPMLQGIGKIPEGNGCLVSLGRWTRGNIKPEFHHCQRVRGKWINYSTTESSHREIPSIVNSHQDPCGLHGRRSVEGPAVHTEALTVPEDPRIKPDAKVACGDEPAVTHGVQHPHANKDFSTDAI